MSFKQFVAAEGGRVAKLVVGSLAVGAGAHSIEKDVRRLKKTRCCAKIKHNYRQMAKRHHTDKHGKQEDFIELTEAKEKALETCDDSACRSKKNKKHIKSAKKRAKAYRRSKKSKEERLKRKHQQKKEQNARREKEQRVRRKGGGDNGRREGFVDMAAAGLVLGGVAYAATHKPKKKIKRLRQSSDEDYKRATGHPRRG